MPKQGSRELGCLEELARSLVGKQYDTKQEDSLGDHGTRPLTILGYPVHVPRLSVYQLGFLHCSICSRVYANFM
jgi:hypothetical protein